MRSVGFDEVEADGGGFDGPEAAGSGGIAQVFVVVGGADEDAAAGVDLAAGVLGHALAVHGAGDGGLDAGGFGPREGVHFGDLDEGAALKVQEMLP